MTEVVFDAFEYRSDQSFAKARFRMVGSVDEGWRVERDGELTLQLGAGYRALRVRQCGVCSTDLARHFLPFPLPQVIGHEIIALDAEGRRYVVEINASHHARGVAADCAFCAGGLSTHCPERITLGIHDLPGGFGPWVLAPVHACLEVPAAVPDSAAVLVEPLAAALHAVTTVQPRSGERIAVLGPRRLGMLVVAALAASRDGYTVEAVVRDPGLVDLATSFGADQVHVVGDDDDAALAQAFDVVIDTTGSPGGLERAVRLARREVHLKSTHGQPAGGVQNLTELVVDELSIVAESSSPPAGACVVDLTVERDVAVVAERLWSMTHRLPRADVVVVDSVSGVPNAIRPVQDREQSLVRPRGSIVLARSGRYDDASLLAAIAGRGLKLWLS